MRVLANAYIWRLPRRNWELRAPLDFAKLGDCLPKFKVSAISTPWAVFAGNLLYAVDHTIRKLAPGAVAALGDVYFNLTHSTILPSTRRLRDNFDVLLCNESVPLHAHSCPI